MNIHLHAQIEVLSVQTVGVVPHKVEEGHVGKSLTIMIIQDADGRIFADANGANVTRESRKAIACTITVFEWFAMALDTVLRKNLRLCRGRRTAGTNGYNKGRA